MTRSKPIAAFRNWFIMLSIRFAGLAQTFSCMPGLHFTEGNHSGHVWFEEQAKYARDVCLSVSYTVYEYTRRCGSFDLAETLTNFKKDV